MYSRHAFRRSTPLVLGVLGITLALSGAAATASDAPVAPAPPALVSTAPVPSSVLAPAGARPGEAAAPAVTPAQQVQLEKIEQQHQADVQRLTPVIEARRTDLAKLLSDPHASQSAIQAAMYRYVTAQADVMLANIAAQREKRGVYQPTPHAPVHAVAPTASTAAQSGCGAGSSGCTGSGCGGTGGGCGAASSNGSCACGASGPSASASPRTKATPAK